MLEVAGQKFQPGEAVAFQPADAAALPFPDASFDGVVCQFGVMFLPDRTKVIARRTGCWSVAVGTSSVFGIRTSTTRSVA
jgi:hypothetical protein